VSLIEEALRKQREETEQPRQGAHPPPPVPDAPSSLPPASDQTHEELQQRSWALLAGLTGAGLLAIVLIIWLVFFGLRLWQNKPEIKPVIVIGATNILTKPASEKLSPIPTEPLKPQPVALIEKPAPQASPPTKEEPPPSSSGPKPSSDAISQPLPTPAASGPEQIVSVTKTPTSMPHEVKLALPVNWPKLVVSGIIGNFKSGRTAAIINGQMISSGDTIEGVRVESIDKQTVKLKFNGEIKTLSAGASTE